MEINVQNKKNNPFFKRDELEVIIDYDAGTPNRNEIQQALAKEIMANKDLLVLSRIIPKYGIKQLKVKAHVYENKEAMRIEVKKKKEKTAGPSAPTPAKAGGGEGN